MQPGTSPQDDATTKLVHDLRDNVLPQATQGTGLDVAVTGQTAVNTDFSDFLSARLPWFFAVVLALSFLLLMAVFRSILVPLKAVVMNLLSIGAAYGLVVAVFQWGWGGSIIGIGEGGPIEPFIPMMMFAIVFGLSMDYEVFLLSRIKEEWDHTHDNARAVADGLAKTARVITAAAIIMVFVFGSFLLESERVDQDLRPRPGQRRAHRRHHRPHAARAGHDGAARRPQLVAAEVARPHPAEDRRRGRPPHHARRGRAGARRRRPLASESSAIELLHLVAAVAGCAASAASTAAEAANRSLGRDPLDGSGDHRRVDLQGVEHEPHTELLATVGVVRLVRSHRQHHHGHAQRQRGDERARPAVADDGRAPAEHLVLGTNGSTRTWSATAPNSAGSMCGPTVTSASTGACSSARTSRCRRSPDSRLNTVPSVAYTNGRAAGAVLRRRRRRGSVAARRGMVAGHPTAGSRKERGSGASARVPPMRSAPGSAAQAVRGAQLVPGRAHDIGACSCGRRRAR